MTGDPIPHATMVLERRMPDSRVWKPVLVADAKKGIVRATVPHGERAFYRWRFVERPLAEGDASIALLIDLLQTPPTEPPSPTPAVDSDVQPVARRPRRPTPSAPSDPSSPSSHRRASRRASRRQSSASVSSSASPSDASDATDESASPSESARVVCV